MGRYSVCDHGNTQNLIDLLKPLLETYGAHYLSGHDHCMSSVTQSGVQYMVINRAMHLHQPITHIHLLHHAHVIIMYIIIILPSYCKSFNMAACA